MARSPRRPSPDPSNARILRIGVVHQGRIVEERLVDAGQRVTVGSLPDCTVVAPGFGRRFTLLDSSRGRYRLHLREGLRGKLARGGTIEPLGGDRRTLPLGSKHRGKVYVGDHCVLFQLVPPPPRPARSRDRRFRGPVWEATDLVFVATLVLSALLHTAAMVWIESQPPPKQLRMEDFPERFVRLPLPQEPEPEPTPAVDAEPDADAVVDGEPAPEASPAPAPEPEPAPPPKVVIPETDEQRERRIADEARQEGILAVIGTAGEGDNPDRIDDFIADATNLRQDVGRALAESGNLSVGRDDRLALRTREGDEGAAGRAGVSAARGGEGGTLDRQKTAVGQVETEEPELLTDPSEAVSVGAEIKRYNARIQACYERYLKDDETLRGKVTVSFTIGLDGFVASVGIEENTTGSDDLGTCVRKAVRRFRFSKRGAEIEVGGYPYLLSPG